MVHHSSLLQYLRKPLALLNEPLLRGVSWGILFDILYLANDMQCANEKEMKCMYDAIGGCQCSVQQMQVYMYVYMYVCVNV